MKKYNFSYRRQKEEQLADKLNAQLEQELNPELTDYYYYALGKDGQHRFFSNYNDHVNFINSSEYIGN